MISAHLSLPVGGEAAYLETLLVEVDAGLGVVHALVVLCETDVFFKRVQNPFFFFYTNAYVHRKELTGEGRKNKGATKKRGKRKKRGGMERKAIIQEIPHEEEIRGEGKVAKGTERNAMTPRNA